MDRLERLRVILLVALGLVTVRLVHLQVVRGAYYRQLAEQNRLRLVPAQAPRGLIVDRQGRLLATNQTLFRVALIPQELEDPAGALAYLSGIVHRPIDALMREYQKERTLAFLPATVVPRVPKEAAIALEESRWKYPGVFVKPETVRHYPLGSTAAHLLGHLSQPTAEELPLLKQYGIKPRQLVGRMGLERLLDHALQGQAGGTMVEVNHRARQMRVVGERAPQPGARVALTIDAQLQSLIEAAFGEQPGAAVVLDPQTGAVLALVSMPEFAPEAFLGGDSQAVQNFFDDPRTPLMNRATMGSYPPGSIAKLVTAAAALEHHIITPETTINCPGSITIGDRTFHCWNRDGHGPMNLRDALMQSCNVYFLTVTRRLGIERLRATQEEIGFSHRTGWTLEEQPGHVPHHYLTEGEMALLGIGQGELLVTPIQAAVMASAFANGGWVVEPWVVREIGGQPVMRQPMRRKLSWSSATIEAVRAGMRAVVNDPEGTGRRAMSTQVSIAGKTGTAQTHLPGKTHAWFAGFCPIEHPRAALAIIAEYGGSGGELPAEIAKAACEYLTLPPAASVQPAQGQPP